MITVDDFALGALFFPEVRFVMDMGASSTSSHAAGSCSVAVVAGALLFCAEIHSSMHRLSSPIRMYDFVKNL